MTTINTMDDFARILRENPDWADTIRSLLLSKELLELPQTFAKFAESNNRRMENLERGQEELRTGQEELRTGQEELRTGQEELRTGQEELRTGQKGILVRLENVEEGQKRILDELGALKGSSMFLAARFEIPELVHRMGFRYLRKLSRNDLFHMVADNDTDDMPTPALRSFREADFIIEVADQSGATNYLTAEASFTVDERDVERVVRNAEYIRRFTGKPGRPVLMGVRYVNEVASVIDSSEIYWYQIDESVLAPE